MKLLNKFDRLPFLLWVLVFLSISSIEAYSQFYVGRINTYAVTTFSETYSNVGGSSLGAGDDVVFTTTLPFNFNYDNTVFTSGTTVYIGSNGFVKFGGTNPGSGCCGNMLGSSTYGPGPVILGYDMVVQGGIYVETTGSSPNRVMSIEWRTTRRYSGNSATTDYKVRLYETTNYIDLMYKDFNYQLTTSTATMGCGLNSTTSPSFITVVAASPTTSTPTTHYKFKTPAPNVQLFATPESMNFGSQNTGTSVQGIITVTHVGTEQTLQINSANISGINASDFSIISGPANGTNLAVGQSVVYTVQFTPSFGGNRTGIFTVVTNGRDSGIQATTMTGFGIAPKVQVTPAQLFKGSRVLVGDSVEQSIVISSIGAAQLYFTNYPNSFILSGDDASSYSVSRRPMNPLPPGASDTIKIRFKPNGEGARWDARVTIYTNAENAPDGNVVTFKGTGIIPRMVIAPTFVDFDSVMMGDSGCKQITVYNVGSDTLRLKNQYFSSNDNDFSFTALAGQAVNIPGNDSAKITICFKPLQKGTRQARLRIIANIPLTFETYPRDTSAVDVDIRGNAIPLDRSIIALKKFDDVIVGEEGTTTLELTNVGTDPVIVKAPVITGLNAAEFSIVGTTFPITINPTKTSTMTVSAKPLARGNRLANFKFNLTSEERAYSVATDVQVNALLACASSNVSSVSFDKLLLNETASKTVEISNCGDIAQTFTAALAGSDAYSLDMSAIEVPAGSKGQFTVTFSPKTEGQASASLSIKGSHVKDMNVTLNGTGEKKPDVTQSVAKTTEVDGFILEQNSPNPAVGYTSFTFTAPKQSNVRLYLADISGKVVKEVANSAYTTGKHTVTVDTKDLASGSYVYILEAGATRIMRQMVVSK